jgi:hypothetical protein
LNVAASIARKQWVDDTKIVLIISQLLEGICALTHVAFANHCLAISSTRSVMVDKLLKHDTAFSHISMGIGQTEVSGFDSTVQS